MEMPSDPRKSPQGTAFVRLRGGRASRESFDPQDLSDETLRYDGIPRQVTTRVMYDSESLSYLIDVLISVTPSRMEKIRKRDSTIGLERVFKETEADAPKP